MTNREWVTGSMGPNAKEIEIRCFVTMSQRCEMCLAQELCEEEFPDGTDEVSCGMVVDRWLGREHEKWEPKR